mmetsp:Transcript_52347/g.59835  ORF Transcript_52347/g.59835 Transcript_52347/m.59835 type:complete len:235 (+) Transcript_52347:211-915(+)|eukprot:CAMPEP_0114993388 /NCGR_PEP_ID=MMETSP0216-20121206/12499_1 /TAXON_ID=223996 /ORGANISM="Protocruzia adherens, Strain Boccale" /LENGTH=234 /DNA_ID=CAMNT_0002357019 /DNA_START=187 /DNA_END=891 /DNA_ORIENTATION=+
MFNTNSKPSQVCIDYQLPPVRGSLNAMSCTGEYVSGQANYSSMDSTTASMQDLVMKSGQELIDSNDCCTTDTDSRDSSEPESYLCTYPDCSKEYTTRFNLRRHILLAHLRSKNFECLYCGKKFALNQYLKEHMKFHARQLEMSEDKTDDAEKIDDSQFSAKKKQKIDFSLLGKVRKPLCASLPVFKIYRAADEELLPTYTNYFETPDFIEKGRLPVPTQMHSSWLNNNAQEEAM